MQTTKYPIGIQNFEDLRKGNWLYIDKTDLIFDLVNSGKYYFLSRPRRFGKSLLISTLEAYFQGKKTCSTGLQLSLFQQNGNGIRFYILTSTLKIIPKKVRWKTVWQLLSINKK